MTTKPCLNLLIVDDRPEDHELYLSFLKHDHRADYSFFHAYNGEEALRIFHQNKIDCILLDNNMPKMSGIEVLQKLAEETGVVPAIMLTGEGNEALAVTAMKLGSIDYLSKNVITPTALQRAIRHTFDRADILRQVESTRQELHRSNNDLEQFASIVAHDLKAPLRAITQHLQIVEQENKDKLDPDSLMSLHFAVDGAARMRRLIESLFDFARFGFHPTAPEPLDGNDMLAVIFKNLESEIRDRQAQLTYDPLPVVLGDPVQIQQLFQNLISNALKYCEGLPRIHISAVQQNGMWEFSIKDNGIGIAPDQRERIFQIFRRLHGPEEYAGMGVGLAVCDRVVKNHGGRIWVEGEPEEGSIFRFTLPATPAVIQKKAANA
jgi:light-regulated signal transduction histidine kinase (bacteriophytochrome)